MPREMPLAVNDVSAASSFAADHFGFESSFLADLYSPPINLTEAEHSLRAST